MGVGVDETGQDQPVRRVHGGRVGRRVHAGRSDGADRVAFDEDVGRATVEVASVEDPTAANDGGSHVRLAAAITLPQAA